MYLEILFLFRKCVYFLSFFSQFVILTPKYEHCDGFFKNIGMMNRLYVGIPVLKIIYYHNIP